MSAAPGAIRLISDGDIAGSIAPCLPGSGVDVYMERAARPKRWQRLASNLGGEILAADVAAQMTRNAKPSGLRRDRCRLRQVYASDDLARGQHSLRRHWHQRLGDAPRHPP
jgi:fructose-1,6-bisphosphatase/sedoheptulose 1,7-bisphosphatase-like protein